MEQRIDSPSGARQSKRAAERKVRSSRHHGPVLKILEHRERQVEGASAGITMPAQIHAATWHWLWRETVNRLDSLQQRVNEGKDLDAAVEFARYIIWSKLDEILKPHDCEGFLKVDSAFLRWKAEELQRSVTDAYRTGKNVPRGEQGQLDGISRKLDLIAAHVAKLTPPAERRVRRALRDARAVRSGANPPALAIVPCSP